MGHLESSVLWVNRHRLILISYSGKIWLLFHSGGKKEYIWNTEDFLGHFLVLLHPVIKSIENYNNMIKVGLLMAQTFQEWRFGSPPPDKEPADVSAEPKGTQNGLWKKVVINTSYSHVASYKNEDCNHHEDFLLILL